MKAQFEIVRITDDTVTIRDLNGPVSVTNDAEAVVDRICSMYDMDCRRLLYYDSDGNLDEIVVFGNQFAGFRVLQTEGRR